jgi:excinuclease ABC subunit A
MRDLDSEITLDKNKKHTIEVVVDRLVAGPAMAHRFADSMEVALRQGNGILTVDVADGSPMLFSERFACIECGISLEEIEPRSFSFNSPYGACPGCSGLGSRLEIDLERVVPDPSLSINEGALAPWGPPRGQWLYYHTRAVAKRYGFDFDTPFGELPEAGRQALLYGTGRERIRTFYESKSGKFRGEFHSRYEGIVPNLERRYRQTQSSDIREQIERFMSESPCPDCGGRRLRKESLAVTIRDLNIADLAAKSVKEAQHFLGGFEPSERESQIAHQILKEIRERLGFLMNVGLDYLTLDRATGTLSGGEAQRIHLATQIGCQLTGVLYILDEPSIGLHQRDNKRLLGTLLGLRDLGNTVLVVEHDQETIETADYIIDLGPGAGVRGGEVVACGTLQDIARCKRSLTGQYISGQKSIPVPEGRRRGNGKWLSIKGAAGNNLKQIDVGIPLGTFTCITGVSGSGKSTLVDETLYRALARRLHGAKDKPHPYARIEGIEHVDKVIDINQSPIGRTPRSNPATYTGVFTPMRQLFAQVPAAKVRGYKPGRFSFNVKGGRCEACQGAGILKIEMHFLPDVYVTCEVCKGKRFNRETLEVQYKGKSIADVLDMTVDEALELFSAIPSIRRKLRTISDVGLGYIHLGQQATTLSGGEAQRVKLASELSKVGTGRTLYILDEPTTGLHFEDIRMLLDVLCRLVDKGNTVLVIEHNLDVIKTADYIIDLGPEGGDAGGEVVGSGTPEELATIPTSHTGAFLRNRLVGVDQ